MNKEEESPFAKLLVASAHARETMSWAIGRFEGLKDDESAKYIEKDLKPLVDAWEDCLKFIGDGGKLPQKKKVFKRPKGPQPAHDECFFEDADGTIFCYWCSSPSEVYFGPPAEKFWLLLGSPNKVGASCGSEEHDFITPGGQVEVFREEFDWLRKNKK